MRVIYVCSPYRGQPPYTPNKRHRNQNKAVKYSRTIADEGGLPIAPHLLFPQFLNDSNAKDREKAMAMGRELLSKCDEVHVFGAMKSEGMLAEIKIAEQLGIPVKYRD